MPFLCTNNVKLDFFLYKYLMYIVSNKIYLFKYTGPDSLVDKASASGVGGRRFDSQCRRHWGSF